LNESVKSVEKHIKEQTGLLTNWAEKKGEQALLFFEKKEANKLLLYWAGGAETPMAQFNKSFLPPRAEGFFFSKKNVLLTF